MSPANTRMAPEEPTWGHVTAIWIGGGVAAGLALAAACMRRDSGNCSFLKRTERDLGLVTSPATSTSIKPLKLLEFFSII